VVRGSFQFLVKPLEIVGSFVHRDLIKTGVREVSVFEDTVFS
jgi:hypothetical protein